MVVSTSEEKDQPYQVPGAPELSADSPVNAVPVQEDLVSVEDVIITPSFYERTTRAANAQIELTALKQLAQFLTADPHVFLEELSKVLMQACGAGSAGVTLKERRNPGRGLRYAGAAGQSTLVLGGSVPDRSPSVRVIENQRPEMFCRPERFYTDLQQNNLSSEELLVVPWNLSDGRQGTVWIASHSPVCRFDAEDLRLMESLMRFADLVLQRSKSEESRRSQQAFTSAARLANQLAHKINNPLQALTNLLHLLPASGGEEYLAEARLQVRRIGRDVQSVLEIERLGATRFDQRESSHDVAGNPTE